MAAMDGRAIKNCYTSRDYHFKASFFSYIYSIWNSDDILSYYDFLQLFF